MSWAIATNGAQYSSRVAVTVDTTGIAPGASVVARLSIGPDLEAFWNTVQSNGYDIRLATGGGGCDHVGHAAGVGLDQFQESTDAGSARLRSVGAGPRHPPHRLPEPDTTGTIDRRSLQERRPVHEQAHRTIEIPFVQQAIGGLRVGLGR